MYVCSVCGNVQYFTELKNIATKIICTEEGEPIGYLTRDILLSVVEVYCDNCKASTEDELILDDEREVLDLKDQDPPDFDY